MPEASGKALGGTMQSGNGRTKPEAFGHDWDLGANVTDEELDDIFASLSAILTDAGLAWLVAQVNEAIQIGRIVTRRFHRGRLQEDEALELTTKTTRNTTIGTDPYGSVDRVNILVNALRVALEHSAALEQEVGHFFANEHATAEASNVISASDQPISSDETQTIAGGNNPAAATASRVLPLLDELSSRIAQP